ncbi:hypothetical protein ABK040_000241 [Willaertia magna]
MLSTHSTLKKTFRSNNNLFFLNNHNNNNILCKSIKNNKNNNIKYFSTHLNHLHKKKTETTTIHIKYDPRKEKAPKKHFIEQQIQINKINSTQNTINEFNDLILEVDVNKITKDYLMDLDKFYLNKLQTNLQTNLKDSLQNNNLQSNLQNNLKDKLMKPIENKEEIFLFNNLMDKNFILKSKEFLQKHNLQKIPISMFIKGMTHISFLTPTNNNNKNYCNDDFQLIGGQLFTTLCNKFMYLFLKFREFKNKNLEKNLRWFLEDALKVEKKDILYDMQFNFFNKLRNDIMVACLNKIELNNFVLFDTNRIKEESNYFLLNNNDSGDDDKLVGKISIETQLELLAKANAFRSLLYLIDTYYDFETCSKFFEMNVLPTMVEYIQRETLVLDENTHYPELLFNFLNENKELKDKFYIEYRFLNEFRDIDNKKKILVGLFVNDKEWESELAFNYTEAKFLLAKRFYESLRRNPVRMRHLVQSISNIAYVHSLEKLTEQPKHKKRVKKE